MNTKGILIALIDICAFVIMAIFFTALAATVLAAASPLKRRRRVDESVNRLSFVIFDPSSGEYPSLTEETLLRGYLSKDFLLYINYSEGHDYIKEIMPGKVYFYSIAAHPESALYKSGFRKLNSILVELKLLRLACGIVLNNNISFVKAHDPHLLGLNGLIVSRIGRLPSILHMNSNFDEKYRGTGRISSPIFISRGIERLFESFIIKSYDMIMADREFYKRSRHFPKSARGKYRTLGVRVDRRHYAALETRCDMRGSLGLEGKKVLLYVGRLHPVKYADHAVMAMASVKKDIPESTLIVAGDGIMRKALEELARRNNIGESVFFLGSKGQEDLVDIFYTADLLIAPHGGVTLVESALAATPAVAYDFDWHSEFIEDGVTGYLVPFGDIGELASKACLLLKNDLLRETMGNLSRERALKTCSRDASLDKERDSYESLIG